MPQNRTMDWLLVIVPGFLSIKFFLEKDMIYGVVWGIVCILYLLHALDLWKKDREVAQKQDNTDTSPVDMDTETDNTTTIEDTEHNE